MSTETTVVKQKGRPVVATSARQARLAARAARIAAGGSAGKGRPANPESKRQARLAERAARLAAGEVIKPGRPKVEKPEAGETEMNVVLDSKMVNPKKAKKAKAEAPAEA